MYGLAPLVYDVPIYWAQSQGLRRGRDQLKMGAYSWAEISSTSTPAAGRGSHGPWVLPAAGTDSRVTRCGPGSWGPLDTGLPRTACGRRLSVNSCSKRCVTWGRRTFETWMGVAKLESSTLLCRPNCALLQGDRHLRLGRQ